MIIVSFYLNFNPVIGIQWASQIFSIGIWCWILPLQVVCVRHIHRVDFEVECNHLDCIKKMTWFFLLLLLALALLHLIHPQGPEWMWDVFLFGFFTSTADELIIWCADRNIINLPLFFAYHKVVVLWWICEPGDLCDLVCTYFLLGYMLPQ
jgi:hypothetical protein